MLPSIFVHEATKPAVSCLIPLHVRHVFQSSGMTGLFWKWQQNKC